MRSVCFLDFDLLFYFAGTNSSFSVMPKPSARRCRVFSEGFAFPFSNLLISACVMPVFSDNSFWVKPVSCRAFNMAFIISNSGLSNSHSF